MSRRRKLPPRPQALAILLTVLVIIGILNLFGVFNRTPHHIQPFSVIKN
jgi:hypothetical protein